MLGDVSGTAGSSTALYTFAGVVVTALGGVIVALLTVHRNRNEEHEKSELVREVILLASRVGALESRVEELEAVNETP